MSITVGERTFDRAEYDVDADVLYLSVGDPRAAVGEETPEGHILFYAEDNGELCGLTLVGPRHILEADGRLRVTMPHSEVLTPESLPGVLNAA